MLLTPDPIVAQLLSMKFGPVENQPEGPVRQLSLDEFQRLDPDLRFMLAVYRVEVRRKWRGFWRVFAGCDRGTIRCGLRRRSCAAVRYKRLGTGRRCLQDAL